MFVAVLTLVALGLVMVGASSAILADAGHGDPAYFLKRQVAFAVAGSIALVMCASVDPAWLKRRAGSLAIFALVLLVLVLIPGLGHVAGGSRRWFQLGPIGVQAGEIAKLAVVVFLAASLSKRPVVTAPPTHLGLLRKLSRGKISKECLVSGVAVLLLLGEPDFGTAVLLAAVTFVMLFVGGARVGPLLAVTALALPLALLAIGTSDYRTRRMLAFLDPWSHRHDIGYQITESLMSVGSGGLFGLGLGESRQKLFFLPAAHTDFIFSIIGEELGFLGVLVVTGCFAVIAVRCWQAAVHRRSSSARDVAAGRSPSDFSSLLIVGLGALLVGQAVFNMAVTLGLVPTKGITLPFVSYGGSSLVMSMATAGLLLRASAGAREPAEMPSARKATGTHNVSVLGAGGRTTLSATREAQ
jgi:cell division protein FtsW